MKIIKLLFAAVCITQLAGCATFWNDMNRAYDESHRQGSGQQQVTPVFTPTPMPTYQYPTYQYPTYQTPQVVQPQLHNTGVEHCRTIGYITTCQ